MGRSLLIDYTNYTQQFINKYFCSVLSFSGERSKYSKSRNAVYYVDNDNFNSRNFVFESYLYEESFEIRSRDNCSK